MKLKETKDKKMPELLRELGVTTVASHIADAEGKEKTKKNIGKIKERIKKPKEGK